MAIHNPYRKKVLGHGDTSTYFQAHKRGITKTKTYTYWINILHRCFDENYINQHPLCKGSSICDDWLDYGCFKNWYDKNYYTAGDFHMILNNNLLDNSKRYSPETCVFLPAEINNIFWTAGLKTVTNNNLPKGIFVKQYKSYRQSFPVYTVNIQGNHIGMSSDVHEALQMWQEAKQDKLKQMIEKYKGEIPNSVLQILNNYKFKINC